MRNTRRATDANRAKPLEPKPTTYASSQRNNQHSPKPQIEAINSVAYKFIYTDETN